MTQKQLPRMPWGRPLVSWDDGTVSNEVVYFKGSVGGCGFTNMTTVVPQSTIDTLGLEKSGEGFTQDDRFPCMNPRAINRRTTTTRSPS